MVHCFFERSSGAFDLFGEGHINWGQGWLGTARQPFFVEVSYCHLRHRTINSLHLTLAINWRALLPYERLFWLGNPRRPLDDVSRFRSRHRVNLRLTLPFADVLRFHTNVFGLVLPIALLWMFHTFARVVSLEGSSCWHFSNTLSQNANLPPSITPY